MSTGKYSPTVSATYGADQEWHRKLRPEDDWHDDEGYDSYGYHKDTDRDRAGYTEWDYRNFHDSLYYYILDQWTFDGVRPVRRK